MAKQFQSCMFIFLIGQTIQSWYHYDAICYDTNVSDVTIFTLPSLPEFVAKYCWTCCNAANMAALRIHRYLGYGKRDAPKVVSQKQGFLWWNFEVNFGQASSRKALPRLVVRTRQGKTFLLQLWNHSVSVFQPFKSLVFHISWTFKTLWFHSYEMLLVWRTGLQGYSRWRSWRSINSAHWLALPNHTLWSRGLETWIWSL